MHDFVDDVSSCRFEEQEIGSHYDLMALHYFGYWVVIVRWSDYVTWSLFQLLISLVILFVDVSVPFYWSFVTMGAFLLV